MSRTLLTATFAFLALGAGPALAQQAPTVLFCKGECFGVTDKNVRIPLTKGTRIAPGLRLETGPGSYLQVKLDADRACALGEGAVLRLEAWRGSRDVLVLERGRIRLVGGEAIGRPGLRPVELRTKDGTITLRSADVEVKAPPATRGVVAPVLVKLNLGDARIGDVALPTDSVRGISSGAVLAQPVAIDQIAPEATVKLATTTQTTSTRTVDLPPAEVKLPTLDQPLSTDLQIAVIGTREQTSPTTSTLSASTTLVSTEPKIVVDTTVFTQPVKTATVLPASSLILAQPVQTATGLTSLNTISKTIQTDPTTETTLRTSVLSQEVVLQTTTTTTTSKTVLSPTISKTAVTTK